MRGDCVEGLVVHCLYTLGCMVTGPIVPSLPDLDTVEDGLIFKKCVRDRVVDLQADNQQIIASDEETEMQELLAQFPDKKRRKILKYVSK